MSERLPHDRRSMLKGRKLAPRESEVLSLVAQGLTNQQIARRLFTARSTVTNQLNVIYVKLGVHNRAAAVAWYVEHQDCPNCAATRVTMTVQGMRAFVCGRLSALDDPADAAQLVALVERLERAADGLTHD